MADITAFPTITDVLAHEGLLRTYVATEAWAAGQVIGVAATAVSGAMVPMDATADEQCMGVAIYGVGAGSKGAVAMDGCVVKVANADDTNVIEQGDWVELNDNAVQGTVSKLALTQFTANHYVVGYAMENIAGGATGLIRIQIGVRVDSTT